MLEKLVKLVGVGKTCILFQYLEKRFIEHNELTIGVEFGSKNIEYNGHPLQLQIWDTVN